LAIGFEYNALYLVNMWMT